MTDIKNTGNKAYWLNIRLTREEREMIFAKCKQTTCRSLSEYARKILFNRTVTVHYRNSSLDKLMEDLILLRKELNFIGNNFNQVVRKINAVQLPGELSLWLPVCKKLQEQLLEKTDVIKKKISQIGKQWLQDS
ncbi:MAG: hypothetical protein EPN39_15390 [Chitinophagaceae bacterium]|nr:MAG: hypothetical protein EPN39_15390 [Chitinophagaceae bacterium]